MDHSGKDKKEVLIDALVRKLLESDIYCQNMHKWAFIKA